MRGNRTQGSERRSEDASMDPGLIREEVRGEKKELTQVGEAGGHVDDEGKNVQDRGKACLDNAIGTKEPLFVKVQKLQRGGRRTDMNSKIGGSGTDFEG